MASWLLAVEQLTFNDNQQLLQAIERLYALHDIDTFAAESLAIVDRLVPNEMPIFSRTQAQPLQIAYKLLPQHADFMQTLAAVPIDYWFELPMTQYWQTIHQASKLSDWICATDLQKLEGIYQQFMRGIGWEDLFAIFLVPTKGSLNWQEIISGVTTCAGICLHRDRANFTERDRLILNLLRPHLLQAYNNTQRYPCLSPDLTQLHRDLDNLGSIILNTLGQIQFIGALAVKLLQTYFPSSANTTHLPELLSGWFKYQVSIGNSANPLQQRLPLCIKQNG
jgi:hypothetical protein